MNDEIISLLEKLAFISELRGETYREKAYRNAILGIRSINWNIRENPTRISNSSIPGVGKGIKNKLIEYATQGTISELVKLENSQMINAYSNLSKIAGAGPKTVAKWISKGIFSIEELRIRLSRGEIELTNVQKYGLVYYRDLNERIPRADVTAIGESVIARIKTFDPAAICEIAGSYRRGATTSGDIDIITTGKYSLQSLADSYSRDPSYIDLFSIGAERFTFIYKYRDRVRQIDVLKLTAAQYWPGILYFTGSWEFNAAMRGYAKTKGYLLNQRGLFKRNGVQLHVKSEQDIFSLLGLRYVEPQNRNSTTDIVPNK